MKNSSASEKSRGVVLFAKNTETIDYVTIAQRSARLIKHHLNLPVTIITDDSVSNNRRYNVDLGQFESWNNLGRYQAYDLSPYDQTLLLDSDYLVLDSNLLKLLDTCDDYKIVRHNRYIDNTPTGPMGKYSIPHLWATVVAFNKTAKSKMLFDFVARIERNYAHYQRLYNISAGNFRNDYAFTIADLALNGYTQDTTNYIPWNMLSVPSTIDSLVLRNNKLHIKTQNQGYVVPKQCIHIMSKSWLQSEQYEQFIKDVTSA